jgi:hypothetical protein
MQEIHKNLNDQVPLTLPGNDWDLDTCAINVPIINDKGQPEMKDNEFAPLRGWRKEQKRYVDQRRDARLLNEAVQMLKPEIQYACDFVLPSVDQVMQLFYMNIDCVTTPDYQHKLKIILQYILLNSPYTERPFHYYNFPYFNRIYDLFDMTHNGNNLSDPIWKSLLLASSAIPHQLQRIGLQDQFWRSNRTKRDEMYHLLRQISFDEFRKLKKKDRYVAIPCTLQDWYFSRDEKICNYKPRRDSCLVQGEIAAKIARSNLKNETESSYSFPQSQPEDFHNILDTTGIGWKLMEKEVKKLSSYKPKSPKKLSKSTC